MEYVASHRCDRMTDQSQPLWWSPEEQQSTRWHSQCDCIHTLGPKKLCKALVRFLSFHWTLFPLCAGNGDKIESATSAASPSSACYVNLQSVVTALLLPSASSRVSIPRRCKIGHDCGGRFRPPLLSLGIVVTRSLLILAPLSLPLRTNVRLVHHAPVSTAGKEGEGNLSLGSGLLSRLPRWIAMCRIS